MALKVHHASGTCAYCIHAYRKFSSFFKTDCFQTFWNRGDRRDEGSAALHTSCVSIVPDFVNGLWNTPWAI